MSHLSKTDQFIIQFDRALRTLSENYPASSRANPAEAIAEAQLTEEERQHVAGLMRVNHVGEVCAQALYQGQALTARNPATREKLEKASQEEFDHLCWCLMRLKELNSHPSYLNLVWYIASFKLGFIAGLCGDEWSLGFVVETENQVESHLSDHLQKLPGSDLKSRAILEQMQKDEKEHADMAVAEGGKELPDFVKSLMSGAAKLMKVVAYRV